MWQVRVLEPSSHLQIRANERVGPWHDLAVRGAVGCEYLALLKIVTSQDDANWGTKYDEADRVVTSGRVRIALPAAEDFESLLRITPA